MLCYATVLLDPGCTTWQHAEPFLAARLAQLTYLGCGMHMELLNASDPIAEQP
jgi:hypothetical protein